MVEPIRKYDIDQELFISQYMYLLKKQTTISKESHWHPWSQSQALKIEPKIMDSETEGTDNQLVSHGSRISRKKMRCMRKSKRDWLLKRIEIHLYCRGRNNLGRCWTKESIWQLRMFVARDTFGWNQRVQGSETDPILSSVAPVLAQYYYHNANLLRVAKACSGTCLFGGSQTRRAYPSLSLTRRTILQWRHLETF